jgi:hypothetical protein
LLRRSLLPTLEAVDSSERGMLARLVLSEARHAPELADCTKSWLLMPGRTMCRICWRWP